ncbi:hypothetical protein AGMMS49938_10920 [Fibrobacterales bacterium]|nr:hypothetical protein AGMMS49938_10920 [Fibrobacterales bacterium]
MPFIVGLISPAVLQEALRGKNSLEQIKKCKILEIRYDLFKIDEWGDLAGKVAELNRNAILLGTIRLEKDGGMWENNRESERFAEFEKILSNAKKVDWIDIERGVNFSLTGVKVIRSWHLFDRVPTAKELNDFAEECLQNKADGCKVATMPHTKSEVQVLYDFAKKYGEKFEWFSAFGMGEIGQESRVRSLKEGANLTYACIGKSLAPGQLTVNEIFHSLWHGEKRIGKVGSFFDGHFG